MVPTEKSINPNVLIGNRIALPKTGAPITRNNIGSLGKDFFCWAEIPNNTYPNPKKAPEISNSLTTKLFPLRIAPYTFNNSGLICAAASQIKVSLYCMQANNIKPMIARTTPVSPDLLNFSNSFR